MSLDTAEQTRTFEVKGENIEHDGIYSNREVADAWEKCAKSLAEHDEHSIKAWKEEIDTLLVFAGLYSAVLTAFNVTSYTWLQPSPPPDATVQLLSQISLQLDSFSVNAMNVNSTQAPLSAVAVASLQAQPVSSSSIRINALWFSSLICTLCAASISILIKQWLREYTNGLVSISRQTARTRQLRDDGLSKWHVGRIIMVLPVLLQGALILFLAGLLELLWTLHSTVAIIATFFVAMLGIFHLVTTILPTVAADCSYQSPQALAVFVVVQFGRDLVLKWFNSYSSMQFKNPWRNLYIDVRLASGEQRSYNWRDRERDIVDLQSQGLDGRMLISADRTFNDDSFLQDVIRPCLGSIEVEAAGPTLSHIINYWPWRKLSRGCWMKCPKRMRGVSRLVLDFMVRKEDEGRYEEQGRDSEATRSAEARTKMGDALHRLFYSPRKGKGDFIEPCLEFLHGCAPSCILDSPLRQRFYDNLVALFTHARTEICQLAWSMASDIHRWRVATPTVSNNALRTMLAYIQTTDIQCDDEKFASAMIQLLMCINCGHISKTDMEFLQVKVLEMLVDLFRRWQSSPVQSPMPYGLLTIGSLFTQLLRQNSGFRDAGLIDALTRICSTYKTANLLSYEYIPSERDQLDDLLSDLTSFRTSNAGPEQSPGSQPSEPRARHTTRPTAAGVMSLTMDIMI